MNKIYLFILALFLIPIVYAAPPFILEEFSAGLNIDTSIFGSIKQDQNYVFNIHVYNSTNGASINNQTTNCSLHLYIQNGSHVFSTEYVPFDSVAGDYALFLDGNNFSLVGQYNIEVHCFGRLGDGSGGSETLSFLVTPNGYELNTQESIFYFISICVLGALTLFFCIISYLMKSPGVKIFFMGLTALNLIVLVGAMVSNSNLFLWKFSEYNSLLSNYYIVLTIGAIGAGLGLIVWFISYVFTLFNKSRGLAENED